VAFGRGDVQTSSAEEIPTVSWDDAAAADDDDIPSDDDEAFHIGEFVEARLKGGIWRPGCVTSVSPLRVKLDGWNTTHSWDHVRRREVS